MVCIYFSLKEILEEKTDKYDSKKSSKSMANSSEQIKYLNERLKTVEEDINRIYKTIHLPILRFTRILKNMMIT